MVMNAALSAFFTGRGKMLLVMASSLFASLVNIVLDYALIDNAYLSQNPQAAAPLIAEHTELFGPAYVEAMATVPEPGTAGVLLVGAGALLLRRRRVRQGPHGEP